VRIIGECIQILVFLSPICSPACPHCSDPIQWARGDVGLKPSSAARPRTSCNKLHIVSIIFDRATCLRTLSLCTQIQARAPTYTDERAHLPKKCLSNVFIEFGRVPLATGHCLCTHEQGSACTSSHKCTHATYTHEHEHMHTTKEKTF